MVDTEKNKKDKFVNSVISKKMLVIAFTSPFILSAIFMAITVFATRNSTRIIQIISLVIAAFLGISLSIGIIFLMQQKINKKISQNLNDEEAVET